MDLTVLIRFSCAQLRYEREDLYRPVLGSLTVALLRRAVFAGRWRYRLKCKQVKETNLECT